MPFAASYLINGRLSNGYLGLHKVYEGQKACPRDLKYCVLLCTLKRTEAKSRIQKLYYSHGKYLLSAVGKTKLCLSLTVEVNVSGNNFLRIRNPV